MGKVTLNELLRKSRREWPGGQSEHVYSVLNLIAHCRTGVLGQMWSRCRECGHSEILPQSCGNRHCPLCLGVRGAQWSQMVCARLPGVEHYHVVFTLPPQAAEVMREDYKGVGDVFFRAVNRTLSRFMKNNLGCEGGFVGVMHTWGSPLSWHPHIHTIVSAGGMRLGAGTWRRFSGEYALPVRGLSKVFRAIFLQELQMATKRGAIAWRDELCDPAVRYQWRRSLMARDWVVYAQPTLKKTRALVRYLARYACRAAIGNGRIVEVDYAAKTVRFTYRDYREAGREKEMTLSHGEFIRRFATHIAPKGFRRIRYYGFLARRSGGVPAGGVEEHPAPDRRCSACGATRWTRRRLSARLFSSPEVSGVHSRKPRTKPIVLNPKSYRFSLHADSDPPPPSNKRMQETPVTIHDDFSTALRRS